MYTDSEASTVEYDYFDHSDAESNGYYSYTAKRAKIHPYTSIKPVIRTNARGLKHIASTAVAISLWNHVDVPRALSDVDRYCFKDTYHWMDLIQEVEQLSNQLPIPDSVAAQIRKHIGKVEKEIANWSTYHFRTVFLNTEKDFIVYNHLNDLIWHSDGRINCEETARNIAQSNLPRLSDVEKFRFLSTYCLKDEMQEMSPVLSNTFRDYVDFAQHPLICYWNRYFAGELYLIPAVDEVNEDLSLDCAMFRNRLVDNWTAKEYFFDRLSPVEQVENAIWLIDECGLTYQKILLMKLNESQRFSVYFERSVKIIKNYAKKRVHWTDLLSTWSDVRGLITRDQFASLIEVLLDAKVASSVLTEIWVSVHFDLKYHLLRRNHCEFVEKILQSFMWTDDSDFVFIVVKDMSKRMKKRCWSNGTFSRFCEMLLDKRESLPRFERLFNVYFDYEKDSRLIKQAFVLNSSLFRKHCLRYFNFGDVKGLNLTLFHLLSHNPDRIQEYKKTLLESETGMMNCASLFVDSKIEALNEIIDDVLPTLDLRTDFRKELVLSSWAKYGLEALLIDNGLDRVKNVVDTFLTTDEDKEKLKKSLVNDHSHFINEIFQKSDGDYVQSVLMWVFGEEELVDKFIESIRLDDVFDFMLDKIVFKYSPLVISYGLNSSSFDRLDNFLKWYFESLRQVKRYKLRRIRSYSNIQTITSLLVDDTYQDYLVELKILVTWFFENDAVRIERFKKTLTMEDKIFQALELEELESEI